jgi:uncharacterized protein
MYIEMHVEGFALDQLAKMPVVILKDRDGDLAVPVYIATLEAVSLATGLMTRDLSGRGEGGDLLDLLMTKLGMTLDRVTLDEAKEKGFTASVHFLCEGEETVIRTRTVDALLASLKYKVPVFVAEEAAKAISVSDEGGGRLRIDDPDRYIEFLEGLDPSDLGKYPM